jgi:hypothetical protein
MVINLLFAQSDKKSEVTVFQHHAMKTYGTTEGITVLTSALERDVCLFLGRVFYNHWIRGWGSHSQCGCCGIKSLALARN